MSPLLVALLGACTAEPPPDTVDPFARFPYDVAPDPDRPDHVDARVETETWTPGADVEKTAQYVRKALEHYPGAPEEVLQHFQAHRSTIPPVDLASPVQLDIAGDLLPVGGGGTDRSALATTTAGRFAGDLAIANLESPTAPGFDTPGLYDLNTDPSALDSLPFDLLQLNNNHTLDAGPGGLAATLREVRGRGIEPLGIERHRIVDVNGVTVALLAYTWGLNVDPDAVARGEELAVDLFVVPFGHEGPVDTARIGDDVSRVRALGAELVVLLVHWGYEYEYYPDPHFLVLGRQLIQEGADLVVGHGPHVAQPAEVCQVNHPNVVPELGRCVVRTAEQRPRTAAVVYSVGNFASSMMTSMPTRSGLIASVSLDPEQGVTGLGWQPVVTLEADESPLPHDEVVPLDEPGTDDPELLEALRAESERLEAHLGVGWRIRR